MYVMSDELSDELRDAQRLLELLTQYAVALGTFPGTEGDLRQSVGREPAENAAHCEASRIPKTELACGEAR